MEQVFSPELDVVNEVSQKIANDIVKRLNNGTFNLTWELNAIEPHEFLNDKPKRNGLYHGLTYGSLNGLPDVIHYIPVDDSGNTALIKTPPRQIHSAIPYGPHIAFSKYPYLCEYETLTGDDEEVAMNPLQESLQVKIENKEIEANEFIEHYVFTNSNSLQLEFDHINHFREFVLDTFDKINIQGQLDSAALNVFLEVQIEQEEGNNITRILPMVFYPGVDIDEQLEDFQERVRASLEMNLGMLIKDEGEIEYQHVAVHYLPDLGYLDSSLWAFSQMSAFPT